MKTRLFFLYCITSSLVGFVSCKPNDPSSLDVEASSDSKTQSSDTNTTALEKLNQEIINNPKSPNVYLKRAYYYKDIYDFDNALDDVNRALKITPEVAALTFAKAEILFNAGGVQQNALQYEQAEIYLNETVRLDSSYLEAHILLARLNLGKPNLEKAMVNINDALMVDQNYAAAYFWKGMIYEMLGKTDLAKSSYQTAIERDINYFDAYNHLGILYAKEVNQEALTYYNLALDLQPSSIEVSRNKGLLLIDLNRYTESILCFESILAQDSSFAECYFNIGNVYIASYRDDMVQYSKDTTLQKALEYFNQAIAISPDYGSAYYNMGLIYDFMNQPDLAKSYYLKTLEILPNYEPALNALN